MTTKDDTRTTQVFDISLIAQWQQRLFIELREIPGFKSRAFGFWKLVDDLARESNSFILGKERPHAPVDIYVWLEHLLGSDGMLGQALQASVACCSCFNYALEIASMYLGADPINRIGFLLTCSTTCSTRGAAGLQYVHLLLGLLARRCLGQERHTYSQCMESPATHGTRRIFFLWSPLKAWRHAAHVAMRGEKRCFLPSFSYK